MRHLYRHPSLISVIFASTCVFFGAAAEAHDHLEAPAVAQDLGADIADVFFFLDPNDSNFAVMAMTVHAFIAPSQNANAGFFDNGVRFQFSIENTGDAEADLSINVTHSKQKRRTLP